MIERFLKITLTLFVLGLMTFSANATIHIIKVRDASHQFVSQITEPIILGDTIQWLPMDVPTQFHTITSTDIPDNAISFDAQWFAPADTFFQYIPTQIGIYNYVCLPHEAMGMVGSFEVEESLGIDGAESENALKVYPNPATDKLYVNKESKSETFRIFGIDGQIIREGLVASFIDISEFTPGVYIVELVGDRRRIVKFVKN